MDNRPRPNIGYDPTPAGGVSNYDQMMMGSSFYHGFGQNQNYIDYMQQTPAGLNKNFVGNPFLVDEKMRLIPQIKILYKD